MLLGLSSVVYWHWTEQHGGGDLRPYYLVQFYAVFALPLLLLLFPPRYTGAGCLWVALGCYALVKVCEHPLDDRVFALGHVVSGHTLEHLAAAAATYAILRMVQTRRRIWRDISESSIHDP